MFLSGFVFQRTTMLKWKVSLVFLILRLLTAHCLSWIAFVYITSLCPCQLSCQSNMYPALHVLEVKALFHMYACPHCVSFFFLLPFSPEKLSTLNLRPLWKSFWTKCRDDIWLDFDAAVTMSNMKAHVSLKKWPWQREVSCDPCLRETVAWRLCWVLQERQSPDQRHLVSWIITVKRRSRCLARW